MDHTFGFYLGLCYLQLNEYQKAEQLLKQYNDDTSEKESGYTFPEGEMVPSFETAAFSLKIGEISERQPARGLQNHDSLLNEAIVWRETGRLASNS